MSKQILFSALVLAACATTKGHVDGEAVAIPDGALGARIEVFGAT